VTTDSLSALYFSVETGEPPADGYKTLKAAGVRFSGCGPGPSKVTIQPARPTDRPTNRPTFLPTKHRVLTLKAVA
jgi:hypothetical protein